MSNGILTLTGRIGPQTGLAVTETEASMGAGTDGKANNHAVYVEDMASVRVTAYNAGANNVTVCKVQANPFVPDEDDPRWVDLVPFPNLPLAPAPGGTAERVIIQIEGYRWLRVRAACGPGDASTLDLVWSGSQG
jgi:hypothetical protein